MLTRNEPEAGIAGPSLSYK